MGIIFYVLLLGVSVLFAFYAGIIMGIKETKRRFNIPKGEMPTT